LIEVSFYHRDTEFTEKTTGKAVKIYANLQKNSVLAMSHFDFPAVEAATSLLAAPTIAKSPFGDCRTPRRWGFANVAAISIAGFGQM
jgi:hypothetical protein